MKKLPNIIFFLIIGIGAYVLYLAFGGDPAITPKNFPTDNIEKIEIKRYKDDKVIVITDKVTIDSLVSLLYQSKPIKVDNPAISKGYFYIKMFKINDKKVSVGLDESLKEGKYHTLGKYKYKNNAFFVSITKLFSN